MKYRCNAIVEAIQVREDNISDVLEFCKEADVEPYYYPDGSVKRILLWDARNENGNWVYPGDYLINASSSDVFPFDGIISMDEGVFESVFAPIDENKQTPTSYWDM